MNFQARSLVRVVNWSALVSVIYLAFRFIQRATPSSFHFQMTWLVYVYIAGAAIIAAFFIPLRKVGVRNRVTFWVAIYMFFAFLLEVGGAFRTASADAHTYIFWYYFFESVYLLISPIFLVLVLTYTDRQDLLYRPLTWLAIFGSLFFILPIAGSTDLLGDPAHAARHSFGYASTAPPGSANFGLWLWSVVILLVGIILLLNHYKEAKKISSKRKQARLFLLANVIPVAVGFIASAILPIWKIEVPIDPLLALTQVTLISYAIYRYRLFGIDPTALSGTILETVNESVITINTNNEVEYLNMAAQRLLHVSQSGAKGRRINSLFDDVTSAAILAKIEAPQMNSDAEELISEIHGKRLPISLAVSHITLKGITEGYVLVLRDVSKEHAQKHDIERQVALRTSELNHEHARLQAAIDSLDVGLMMTFKDRSMVSYNNRLPKILGLPSAALKSLTLESVQQYLQASQFNLKREITACQNSGKPFEVRDVAYGKQVLRIFGAPISLGNGMIIGTVVLIDDITEATVVERSKDEFFSIASHELRTPLTSIKGNTSMILDYYKDVLKDKALKEMIDDVHESSVRLINIVNDFLDVSRLEQSKISFVYEPVSLESVIEGVAYEMKAVISEKKVYLKVDKPTLDRLPKVWADKNRLKQVVYNLIGNALKFTEEGGITLTAELSDNNMVRVSVIDTGRGMSEDSQKLLFHKFQQASSSLLTRDTTRGTGLGLYISKMIVENMGGAISLVKSVEGVGTTFAFTVPIVTPHQLKATPGAPLSIHTDPKTGLTITKEREK